MEKLFTSNIEVAAGIAKQMKGEADAIEEYFEFKCRAEKLLPESAKKILDEIIRDEMNHIIKWEAILSQISKLQPMDDDLQRALTILGRK